MLGELVTRILMLILGYAYPAFECFKTVERNKVQIEDLRFWCRYWILVAIVTVLEKLLDMLVSWVPMYAEMKLALFIYLWYPKTKGTGVVYETLLRPYMSKHETDIDKNLQEFRVRAWDLLIYYWQNCTELGQSTFLQMVHYLASQVGKLRQPSLEREGQKSEKQETIKAPPKSPPSGGFFRRHKQASNKRQPPIPPPSPYY